MPEPGELTGIAVRSKSRAPMQECLVAEATTDSGIADDFRGKGKRPVTLMSEELWAEVERGAVDQVSRESSVVSGLDVGK